MTSLPHILTGGYIIFGSLKKGYSSADVNCVVCVYLKYMCQNISLKTCACLSTSRFVSAIYVTITRIKCPLCVSYIMMHTYMHSSHNEPLITSDNTTQNTAKLLCLKQHFSLLHVCCITILTVAAERPAHERVGIRTMRGKR
jgi:hypothetical protein